MIDKIPVVFISYSWSSESYKQRVKELAERLIHDGINVKLDIWDLKDGQNKYAYMQQCVTNPEIDRVLILSDRIYAEKADSFIGGVGDETVIISPEIYGHEEQQKFIPIIMERDKNGNAYLPAYLKGCKYRDFSGSNFEKEYEGLVRTIYDEPLERKPELGSRPAWLNPVSDDLYPLKEAVRITNEAPFAKAKSSNVGNYLDVYVESLKKFFKVDYSEPQEYINDFVAMKDYRDSFLEYISIISEKEHFGAVMADIFENLYNKLFSIKTFCPDAKSCSDTEFDIFRVHIWELFICTVTYMLHYELFADLHELLYHTYFLRQSALSGAARPESYKAFRYYSFLLEERFKPKMPDGLDRRYTLTGHYVVTKHELLPLYTKRSMSNADLFLYQVFSALRLDDLDKGWSWFPMLYVYADYNDNESMWTKLRSEQFCRKIMPLFGVDSLDELKERVNHCTYDDRVRYNGGFVEAAPAILSFIRPEEIGILP